jgi:hypothetical protein
MKTNTLISRTFFILILSLIAFSFSQKSELDPRVVGRWNHIADKDFSGNRLKNDFSGKNYINTFTKNGKYLGDPNYLRDDMKKHGINEPLDYNTLPSFDWKTKNNEILELITPYGNIESHYRFSADTLIMVFKTGNQSYFLKVK